MTLGRAFLNTTKSIIKWDLSAELKAMKKMKRQLQTEWERKFRKIMYLKLCMLVYWEVELGSRGVELPETFCSHTPHTRRGKEGRERRGGRRREKREEKERERMQERTLWVRIQYHMKRNLVPN